PLQRHPDRRARHPLRTVPGLRPFLGYLRSFRRRLRGRVGVAEHRPFWFVEPPSRRRRVCHDGRVWARRGGWMRISLWGGGDATTVKDVVGRVGAAAEEGFEAIWFPQTASIDALTALAVAASQVGGIHVGTAVVPIQGRHPIPLAQQALTLADAAGPGRVTLGVGVTHAPVSEGWYGIPYAGIVELCAEELEALAPLLSDARRADVAGSRVTARIPLPLSVPAPGLVLAALGPKMLDLAGRLTDGTVTWMTGVNTLGRDVVPRLRAAAAAAGRPDPRVVVGLPVCVTDDVAGARH